jgi:hypothetical protein
MIRTDRPKDIDVYYNDHVKMGIIRRLQEVKTWAQLMGIQSAVHDALSIEQQNEKIEREAFEKWKASQEETVTIIKK